MKMRITIVAEYDVTDDHADRLRIYGTADPAEMAKVDQGNDPVELLELAEIVKSEVEAILPADA